MGFERVYVLTRVRLYAINNYIVYDIQNTDQRTGGSLYARD
ncbi:hypothetical protein SDC9_204004 [bioreactor metagenome]|uniref:Uncharacterized protein n=1 Tax=bioreactor metagenome TaxID=1076179 RepID=A0A645IYP5_9ZZZZ